MTLQCLPQSTIKLIGSSQVITSASAAIKELVENALDAGALSIDVKLENHGMDKIEVRDDGCGINKDDIALMCKKSYTSKITCFTDLDRLRSYGFRGEALNALCAVSKLSVTTKTEQDDLAYTYQFDCNGSIKESKPSHINKGTIIVVEGLFRNLPVRRQFLTNGRRRSEEIKKVESIVKSFAIIHPRLRATLVHNKFLIWQKNSVANLKQSLAQTVPPTIISQLDSVYFCDPTSNIEVDILLPRKSCNISVTCFSSKEDAIYLFINLRPIRHKAIEKVVEGELFQYFGHYIPANKFPLCLLSIKIPSDELDVNLEPNKTKVVIKELDYLIEKLKGQFLNYYTGIDKNVDPKTSIDFKLPKRTLDVGKIEENYIQNKLKIPKLDTNVSDTSQDICNSDINSQNSTEEEIGKSASSYNCGKNEDRQQLNDNNTSDSRCDIFNEESGDFLSKQTSNEDCSNNNKLSVGKHFSENNENVDHEEQVLVNSQDLDSVEEMLASSQVPIIATPDFNDSYDYFISNVQNLGNDTTMITEAEVYNNKSIINESEKRDETVNEFLSGLPVTHLNENTNDFKNGQLKNVEVVETSIPTLNACKEKEENKSDEIELDSITLSQWSRGHVLNSNSVPVEPCVEVGLSEIKKFPFEESEPNSSQMDRSVSSQMGCKNMSAFTKFAKEMRTKIIQQTPGISFTRVAAELASKWRDLTEYEKTHYQELVEKDKGKPNVRKTNTPEPKLKQLSVKPKIISEPKGLKKMKYHKTVEVNLTIDTLKQRIKSRCLQESNFPQMVGKLSEDLYCFSTDDRLSVLSTSRMNEVINYYKNMSTMTIPLRVLENNIPIKKEDLGEMHWHTLHCLETSVDLKNNTIIISTELITKNGFRIEVTEGAGDKHFELTDVPTHVSFYGVGDLKEVLEIMDKHGINGNLLDCRPLKIASYIRSETIRRCSNTQFNFDSEGYDSMFNFWVKNVRQIFPNCPHFKPVSQELPYIKESSHVLLSKA